MKNKFFFVVIIACLVLSACKKEVDVMGTNDVITVQTINKNHAHVETGENLSFSIAEYTFLKDGSGTRIERSEADGSATHDVTVKFTWELGDYGPYTSGRTIHIYPEKGDAYDVLWQDGVIVENDVKFDVSSLLSIPATDNFKTVYSDFPNTKWEFRDSTFWVDTIHLDSLRTYTKNVRDTIKDPVTGEPLQGANGKDSTVIVEKTFTDSVFYDVYDTIGTNEYWIVNFEAKRDASTFANTGSYVFDYKAYARDSVIAKDSVASYDFHWGYTSVASKKKFGMLGVTADNDSLQLTISDFALKDKVLTISGNVITPAGDTLAVSSNKLKLQ